MRVELNQKLALGHTRIQAKPTVSEEVAVPLVSDSSVSSSTTPIQTNNSFSSELISQITKASKQHYTESKQVMTFGEFLNEVERDPVKHLRPVTKYMLDGIDYWDKVSGIKAGDRVTVLGKEVRPFAFTRKPWEPKELIDKECVQGQLLFWNDLYEKLEVIARKKHPNKMIIVHGPNATGKSRVFETLFQALEEYSKTDEGALYTYEWVFGEPIGQMGFRSSHEDKKKSGPISRDDVVVSIPAGKNGHPIFLLSKEQRVAFLNKLETENKLPSGFNKDYIISNEMNDLSKRIYEALWNYYEGDIASILNHVHVTRWNYSTQGRRGVVLIQPQVTPNSRLEPITPDIDWDALPRPIMNAFRTAGLHVMHGDEANANHGIIVYDDVFKEAAHGAQAHGSMDSFLYLLRFAEKAKTTVSTTSVRGRGAHAIDEQFDILLFGTTNDDTLMNLEEHYEEWDSLKLRFILTPMWFERCYGAVAQVFENQLSQLIPKESNRHISPHTLKTFGLWLTMTYLFPSTNNNYYNSLPNINQEIKPKLLGLLKKLTILEKALLYQGEDVNSFEFDPQKQKYNSDEKMVLERHVGDIANEYNLGVGKHKFFFYEGSVGLPSRVAEPILERAVNAKPDECFSILELFDILEDEIKHGFEFEQKRATIIKRTAAAITKFKEENKGAVAALSGISVLPDPPSTKTLLDQAKEHEKRQIRFEVHKALGCIKSVDKQLYSLKKYIEHARAFAAKKAVKTSWEDPEHNSTPNEEFMKRMERIFVPPNGLKDKTAEIEFRGKIREKIGDWSLEHKELDPTEHIREIFPDLVEKMTAHDIKTNKEIMENFLTDLRVYYERGQDIRSHSISKLEPERAKILEEGLKNLKEMGYCDKCIPKIIYFAFESNKSKNDSGIMGIGL